MHVSMLAWRVIYGGERYAYLLGNLELGQSITNPRLEVIFRSTTPILQNHSGSNVFSVMAWIGNSEANSLSHLGVTKERIVHLYRANLLSALVNQFLDAPRDDHVFILVLETLITRAEESILGKGRLVGGRVVQIPLGHVLAANANLRCDALGNLLAGLVEDSNVDSGTNSHASGLSLRRWKRVAGHLV